MAKYIITGGQTLKGKVRISGNKNSILPCLAASLLTEEQIILKNVPHIRDVSVSLQILEELGAKYQFNNHELVIEIPRILTTRLQPDLVSQLRASILFVGPLLARAGHVRFSHPGGDIIGKRSIEPHLSGFQALGYHLKINDGYEISGKPSPAVKELFLNEASVTATENLLMACALNPSLTILRNCAEEPHVVDLCRLLTHMGVEIEGIGSSTLRIIGKEKLRGGEFIIGPDYIELGTYSIAAAITRGKIVMENSSLSNLEPITYPLGRMGIKFEEHNQGVSVSATNLVAIPKLQTNIWPGFPTDMMSLAIVLATQCKGVSLCHDWMYESRMFFVDKLIGMGAHITLADPHRVVVYGPTQLAATDLASPDIRAGMSMLLAALIAKGTSTINRAELIERGYEKVVENLQSLGAKIERVS